MDHLIANAKHGVFPLFNIVTSSQQRLKFIGLFAIGNGLRDVDVITMVNDFVDIAIVNADGVHVGQDDMPIQQIRAQLGSVKIIGRATHSFEQGQQAVADGVIT